MSAPAWWADEVALVAERTGIAEGDLASALPQIGQGPTPPAAWPQAWLAPAKAQDLARVFEAAAATLSRSAERGDVAFARAQLVELVVVGELIGAHAVAWWAMGAADAADLIEELPRLSRTLLAAAETIAASPSLDPTGIELEPIERRFAADEPATMPSPVMADEPRPAPAPVEVEVAESEAPPREVERPRVVARPKTEAPVKPPVRRAPPEWRAEPEKKTPVRIASPRGTRPTALIADDAPVAARFLERMLAGRGMEVVLAPDATTACAALEQRDFEVVFWDRDLPGLDGDALLATRPEWSGRVVLLTDGGGGRARGAQAATLSRPPAEEELDSLSIPALWRAGARANTG